MSGHRIAELMRSRKLMLLAVFDAMVWAGSLTLFTMLRFDFSNRDIIPWTPTLLLALGAALLHLTLGWIVRLHHGRARLASLDEMILLGVVTVSTGLVVSVGNALGGYWLPSTVPVAATFIALVVMAWGRAIYRRVREPMVESEMLDGKTPVVIVGAGEAGHQLIASMLREHGSMWMPMALVDDDPLKRHLRVRGVPVLGTTDQLSEVADRVGAGTVIVAIPSAPAEYIRDAEPPRERGWPRPQGDSGHERSTQSPCKHLRYSRHRRHRPARPSPDRDRPVVDRRLPHRQARAGHRRRRLDRLGAVPPDRTSSARPS